MFLNKSELKLDPLNLLYVSFFLPVFLVVGHENVLASEAMITDSAPGVIMKLCGNNPLGKDFNSESVSGGEIFNRCAEIYDGYSWGSRIYVLIFAPAWNTDPHKLDVIGNNVDNPITARSRDGSMSLEGSGCNGFVETGFDHGVFFGSIKLSGFRYDITGDGAPDLFGGNRCERTLSILDDGSGRVEARQDGAVTITWQYYEDKHISKTATYGWRDAVLEFDKEVYSVNDKVNLVLNDLDNLRFPFDDDMVYEVKVYSDTDGSGISLDALWKTDYKGIPQRTGTYPVEFFLTDQKESRDNGRLRVSPGDTIYAEYWDYTLPKPYMVNDRKKITTIAQVSTPVVDIKPTLAVNSKITDVDGNPMHHCKKNDGAVIETEIVNTNDQAVSVSVITQIKNSDGVIQNISWSTVTIAPKETTDLKSEWVMKDDKSHIIEIFVWDDLSNPQPLSQTFVSTIQQHT